MVIYYSILAYTVIISCLGCILKSKRINHNPYDTKQISLFMAILSFALLAFFVGMRTEYQDTYGYILSFKNINIDLSFSSLKEMYLQDESHIGWDFMQMAFKKYISKDYSNWFLFLSIFQAGAFVSLAYRYSSNYIMSAFLYIASTEFIWMMNGIRQYTAVCLVMYFFSYIRDRKLIKFLIVIFFAYLIHSSAIFWIPIYFIIKFKPFSKQIWIFVALTLVIVFFIDNFTSLLDSSLENTQYAGTGSMLTNYNGGETNGEIDDGVNPIRVLVAAVPAGLALWQRKQVNEKRTPAINLMINLSTASVGIYLMAMVTSGIMVGRIPVYFTMVNYILLPWLLENVVEGALQKLLKVLCYFFYFLYFYYTMAIQGAGFYISSVLNLYLF